MPKRKNKFKAEMKGLQAQHGRKLNFVVKLFNNQSRQWFHKKLNAQSFTEVEQQRIREIIISGK